MFDSSNPDLLPLGLPLGVAIRVMVAIPNPESLRNQSCDQGCDEGSGCDLLPWIPPRFDRNSGYYSRFATLTIATLNTN